MSTPLTPSANDRLTLCGTLADTWRVEVTVSPEARSFVRERGGLLFVHMHRFGTTCCRITLLETTTEPPPDALEWRRITLKGLTLFTPRSMPLPDVLDLRLKGRFRRRIEALWNGCAYVI